MKNYEVVEGTVYTNNAEYKKGDIIKEKLDKDDIKRLEKQGFIKEYVSKITENKEEKENKEDEKIEEKNNLGKMSKTELVKYCNDNNIAINEEDTVKEILEKIKEADNSEEIEEEEGPKTSL